MAPVSAVLYIPAIVFNCVLSIFSLCLFFPILFFSFFSFCYFFFHFQLFCPLSTILFNFSFVFDLNGLVSMFCHLLTVLLYCKMFC